MITILDDQSVEVPGSILALGEAPGTIALHIPDELTDPHRAYMQEGYWGFYATDLMPNKESGESGMDLHELKETAAILRRAADAWDKCADREGNCNE